MTNEAALYRLQSHGSLQNLAKRDREYTKPKPNAVKVLYDVALI